MVSERVQRQINALLDEAEAAIKRSDWTLVRERAQAALRLDPQNPDARAYLEAAEREPSPVISPAAASITPAVAAPPPLPASFASGRYAVKKFLGEGGKKKVYLAHDTRLDRDIAFALIKTEALDDVSRERILREAQAMGRLGAYETVQPQVSEAPLQAGDWVVVCSDGLHGAVSDEEIAESCDRAASPQGIATWLVELANQRGGEDNITVAIAHIA